VSAVPLRRLLKEAGGDKARWADVICRKITDPSIDLVTKGHLDKRFAEQETRLFRTLVATQAAGFFALGVLIVQRG